MASLAVWASVCRLITRTGLVRARRRAAQPDGERECDDIGRDREKINTKRSLNFVVKLQQCVRINDEWWHAVKKRGELPDRERKVDNKEFWWFFIRSAVLRIRVHYSRNKRILIMHTLWVCFRSSTNFFSTRMTNLYYADLLIASMFLCKKILVSCYKV